MPVGYVDVDNLGVLGACRRGVVEAAESLEIGFNLASLILHGTGVKFITVACIGLFGLVPAARSCSAQALGWRRDGRRRRSHSGAAQDTTEDTEA